jgi:hypothetical protein
MARAGFKKSGWLLRAHRHAEFGSVLTLGTGAIKRVDKDEVFQTTAANVGPLAKQCAVVHCYVSSALQKASRTNSRPPPSVAVR